VAAVKKALEARETGKAGFAKAKDLPAATAPLEQKIQSLEQSLQKQSSMLPIYVAIWVVVGLAAGCAVMWVVFRRKSPPQSSATTQLYGEAGQHHISCGNEITHTQCLL
jgi:uncharacterized protein YybS (DUF2232 family)